MADETTIAVNTCIKPNEKLIYHQVIPTTTAKVVWLRGLRSDEATATLTNTTLNIEPAEDCDHPFEMVMLPLHSVTGVLSRTYMLTTRALEVFMEDNYSYFIIFENEEEAHRLYKAIVKVGGDIKEKNFGSPHKYFAKMHKAVQQWRKRGISNYQYLLMLNRWAGRSFHDLNQYPVFPWVLSDYESEEIDLTKPKHYRDLLTPVGALNATKLEKLQENMVFLKQQGDPYYLYGTHYSSPAIVLYYLARVEPYTTYHREFHGSGDKAERMFSSIRGAWEDTLNNPADVKELIPSFSPSLRCLRVVVVRLGTSRMGVVCGGWSYPPGRAARRSLCKSTGTLWRVTTCLRVCTTGLT